MKLELLREDDVFKIYWTYQGKVPLKSEIVIEKVRAVDSANNYISKNSEIRIHSISGEQMLKLDYL